MRKYNTEMFERAPVQHTRLPSSERRELKKIYNLQKGNDQHSGGSLHIKKTIIPLKITKGIKYVDAKKKGQNNLFF